MSSPRAISKTLSIVNRANKCGQCGALYTGTTPTNLCGVCTRRKLRAMWTDRDDFISRLEARAVYNELLYEAHNSPPAPCLICNKRLDDHGLTYTDHKYPHPLCLSDIPDLMQ